MQPYVHYIPVAHDMSNVMSMINWTLSHPETAQRIGQQAQKYAKRYLNNEVRAVRDGHMSRRVYMR